MWSLIARIALLVSAALHLYFGAVFAVDPGSMLPSLSLATTSAAGIAEMRAFYGGLMLALGALFLAGSFRVNCLVPAVILMTVTYSGAASVRALSLLVDSVQDRFLLQILAIESVGGLLGAACLAGLLRRGAGWGRQSE